MPSILCGVLADQGQHRLHGRLEVAAAPVAGERGIEHLAEPVQDHLAAALADQAAIDGEVVVRPLGDAAERAARHQDDLAAMLLDMADLLLIGADHVVEAARGLRIELVGAGAAGEIGARRRLGLGEDAGDQLGGVRPVQPHAALRGVHRLGDLEAQTPEMAPEGERRVPVDGRLAPGLDQLQRVGDDMGGGIDGADAVGRRGVAGKARAAPAV